MHQRAGVFAQRFTQRGFLERRLQHDVGKYIPRQFFAQRHHRLELQRGNALRAAAQPCVVRYPQFGTQQQRVQILFAKLPMAHPVFTLVVAAEGQVIDKYRLRAVELYVIRGGIRQGDVMIQRFKINIELQQRGRFER